MYTVLGEVYYSYSGSEKSGVWSRACLQEMAAVQAANLKHAEPQLTEP